MPQLHARGVELVVELLDAAEHFEQMPPDHIKKLLRETSLVLGDLLARDVPPERPARTAGNP
ncbi:hypothetical protein G6N74_28100 [Mesorhizobium sp. CGMCC 1.15528]|uniref:Uncharacterized protein n=1 Tax=Mesorhizobium zhangyense TaxID=1776730 RepID=A0A7C9VDS5_9HYPH|nr:hypothetical protein [Mesorhizobium zhangyense]NGN44926.1 hypothetical protein [Mesorhizobium zhangyense]